MRWNPPVGWKDNVNRVATVAPPSARGSVEEGGDGEDSRVAAAVRCAALARRLLAQARGS
ncbi:hypothetical protein GCM10010411_53440 [Actinomadura fulvescens]|uniref:Uncharacterized protein n=1 Tax=Actinomadura fulvescens TaxID=46160 RepID=A0ABP6CCD0_9ACTN